MRHGRDAKTLGGNVMNETIRMQLSAYVDGELPESETELLLRRLSQDAVLRAEVAEFIEIGRSVRGECSVDGIHGLRQRIADALDSDAAPAVTAGEPLPSKSFVKPLGGVAVAAAVALIALIGLRQTSTVVEDPAAVADSTGPASEYVVPPQDPEMREFLRMHGQSSSAQGANGMNVRIVSFPLGEDAEGTEAADNDADDGVTPAAEGRDAGSIEE